MSSAFILSSSPQSLLPFDMALSTPSETPQKSLSFPITSPLISQDKGSFSISKNTTLIFICMNRKPQLLKNLFAITPTNAPTFANAQSAKDLDMFEGIAATSQMGNC